MGNPSEGKGLSIWRSFSHASFETEIGDWKGQSAEFVAAVIAAVIANSLKEPASILKRTPSSANAYGSPSKGQ